jgi:hypothetical protein
LALLNHFTFPVSFSMGIAAPPCRFAILAQAIVRSANEKAALSSGGRLPMRAQFQYY